MVSDAHLTGPDDPNQQALVGWLGELSVDRLYILGDLFHHWWGYPGAVQTPYVPVCAALLRLRDAGVQIHMVPGNHDFATGPFFSEVLGAEVTGPCAVSLGGRRYLLAHGDEADDRLGYRVTRAVLRGPAFAALMRGLGPARGWRLLQRLAGTSREHMGDPLPLIEQQRRWALRERGDASVVVMGHVHWPGIHREGGVTIVHLGAWIGHRTFLLVEDGELSLRRWERPGAPLGVAL